MPYIIPGGGGCHCDGGESVTNIVSATINEDGHLIFTMEDGTVADTGRLLTEEQLENLDYAFSPSELGDGLLLDENGKLTLSASIEIDGQQISLADGVFTIPQATESTAGFVKLSDEFELNDNGQMTIKELNVNKLVVDDDTELIIGG